MPDKYQYEKCTECHLFVEKNPSYEDSTPDFPIAEYLHLHRGDENDNLIDESHEPKPSGMIHDLDYWKKFGPEEMKERFHA